MNYNLTSSSQVILINDTNLKNFLIVNSVEYELSESFPFKENDYFVFLLKKSIPVGKYTLFIQFRSNVSSTLTGFYKSSYMEDNSTRYEA